MVRSLHISKRIFMVLIALVLGMIGTSCAKTPPAPTTAPSTQSSSAPTTEPTTESTQPTTAPTETIPPVTEPDTVSILDFLKIAVQPVGSTMYIWGGGWNEEDTGAGIEAVTFGLSPQWAHFAAMQDGSYNYKNHKYQIHDGLDCSGYVGWAVYNVLETENGRPGYVCSSTKMTKHFADRGLGSYIPAQEMTHWLPGDIMSMKGHVWIVVGMCSDGSVLLLHASPPGVIFSGTTLPDGSDSEASALAAKIMRQHFPEWYSRYPNCARPHSYLTKSSAMRWNSDILSDEDGLRSMTAEEVTELIFGSEINKSQP